MPLTRLAAGLSHPRYPQSALRFSVPVPQHVPIGPRWLGNGLCFCIGPLQQLRLSGCRGEHGSHEKGGGWSGKGGHGFIIKANFSKVLRQAVAKHGKLLKEGRFITLLTLSSR